MANKCTWWKFYSALVHLMVYHISKVCLALIYMQHKHMVYGKLHIYPYLVLDQNANDNAYSTLLHREFWNVYQKNVILVVNLCYNKFSHLGVQHQHYPEHYTVCLSIFFPWIVFVFYLINDTIFAVIFCLKVFKFLS